MNSSDNLTKFEPMFDQWLKGHDLALAKLLRGEVVHKLEESDARCFEDAVLAELDDQGANKTAIIAWLRIAYLRVKHLRDAGRTDLPFLRLAVSVDPQKSPFVADRMDKMPQALFWQSALWDWLKQQGRDACQEDLRCAALVSAVLCGGLLDPRKVYGLYHTVDKPLQFTRSLTFVEFALPYRQLTVDLHQRWFPDPLSEMLLVRGIDLDTPVVPLSMQKLGSKLRTFLEKAGVPKSQLPISVSALTESAAIYWELVGSQVDVRYARGLVISQSLKHSVWIRLHSEPDSGKSLNDSVVKVHAQQEPESTEDQDDPLLLSLWWQELLNRLSLLSGSGQSVSGILQACEEIFRETKFSVVPKTAQIPKDWLMAMLQGHTTSGEQLKPDTILEYFRLAMTSLLDIYGERDFTTDQTDQLVESYGAILESLPDGINKTRTARGLREFHGHLVRHHKFEPVDLVDVFGREAEIAVVEARLISVDDYYRTDRILNEYRYQGKENFVVEAARLAFMLAFRTGMRRMEIFMLRMEDVHLGRCSDVLVRPHAARRLKSLSSKRRIPLDPLLESDELDRLKTWFAQQQSREVGYLFAAQTGEGLISIEGAVDLIHSAMREATGDDQLHLHHLRHSFATWTYWKMRSVAHPGLAEYFQHLPATSAYLKTGTPMREQLLPGNPSIPTRSEVYCVSRLLGHSGPNISLNHYIHGTDLVVHALVSHELEKVEGLVLSGASGLPLRSTFRYQQDSAATLLEIFRKCHRARYHTDVSPPKKPKTKRGRKPAIASYTSRIEVFKQRFELIWRALQLHDAGKDEFAISSELGLTIPDVNELIENGTNLSKRLGLSTLAPPRPAGDRAKALHDRLLNAVSLLSLENPMLLSDGVGIFVEHFSKHKKDVVFRNKGDLDKATRYLKFLRALGIRDEELQLISREAPDQHPNLDGWVKALRVSTAVRVKHIAPPNQAKSAYDRWIGIQVIYPDNKKSAQTVMVSVVCGVWWFKSKDGQVKTRKSDQYQGRTVELRLSAWTAD